MNIETGERRKGIRILHGADIHLEPDSSAGNLALKGFTELAIQARVDLVVIAGDLFEHNRVTAPMVESVTQELHRVQVPVIILPGNHDCLVPDSIYLRHSVPKLASNIHVIMDLEGETLPIPELDLAIWGKATNCYGGNLYPLGDIPPRTKERWQIAIAHGYYRGGEEEITQTQRDYVALGHAHVFRCVHNGPVKAYYAGARTSAIIADLLDDGTVQVNPYPLQWE